MRAQMLGAVGQRGLLELIGGHALERIGEIARRFGDRRIEHSVRIGDVGLRSHGAELELVVRKRKGRGAVAVGGVLAQGGQHDERQGAACRLWRGRCVSRPDIEGVDNGLQCLVTYKDGDDGRRQLRLHPGGDRCPAWRTDARSRSAYLSTALITAARNTRNCRFSIGVSPGSSRFSSAVDMDQLLCLPLPLTPSKGFSCCRQTSP